MKVIGQERIKARIELAFEAAKQRGEKIPNVLLVGPSGAGKTMLTLALASAVARDKNSQTKCADGLQIEEAGAMAAILTNLEEEEILVVDNIDTLNRNMLEILALAMSDFKLDVVIDHEPEARAVRLNLPRFTLLANATRIQKLPRQLMEAFHVVEQLDEYTRSERSKITEELANSAGVEIDEAASDLIGHSSSGAPKEILTRLLLVCDFMEVRTASKRISVEIAAEALRMLPSDGKMQMRTAIPKEVRREVWRRDGGMCVKCGSRENLEFDHIIPFSKGGSSTVRNIELLCEVCNRAKMDSI